MELSQPTITRSFSYLSSYFALKYFSKDISTGINGLFSLIRRVPRLLTRVISGLSRLLSRCTRVAAYAHLPQLAFLWCVLLYYRALRSSQAVNRAIMRSSLSPLHKIANCYYYFLVGLRMEAVSSINRNIDRVTKLALFCGMPVKSVAVDDVTGAMPIRPLASSSSLSLTMRESSTSSHPVTFYRPELFWTRIWWWLGHATHFYTVDPPMLTGRLGQIDVRVESNRTYLTGSSETVVTLPPLQMPNVISATFGFIRVSSTVYRIPNRAHGELSLCSWYACGPKRLEFCWPALYDAWVISRPTVVTPDVLMRISNDGKKMEFKFHGSGDMHTIPHDIVRAALSRYHMAKTPALGIISTVLRSDQVSAEATACLMSVAQNMNRETIDYVGHPDVSFSALYEGIDADSGKPMNVQPVCNVVHTSGGFGHGAPDISRANELYTIDKRIVTPMSDVDVPVKYNSYAHDFLSTLCGTTINGGAGIMRADHDSVVEQMNRPSQKRNRDSFDTIMDLYIPNTKMMFTKRESVEIGKPARNIVTLLPNRLYEACSYMLPASAYIKSKHDWWVWGVGSGATSRKYHDTCSKYPRVMESDFSKFDASLPRFAAVFCTKMMQLLFSPKDFDAWQALSDDVIYQEGMTTMGLTLMMGHGRLSGCNETTFFNTIFQAFLQYCAIRNHTDEHESAWTAFSDGLYGGDDGIVPYVGQDLESTVRDFGMKVELRVFDSDTPCRFLGRIYPSGRDSPDSYYDLSEFIKCLHLVNMGSDNSVAQGLVNKATGLAVTDSNTPLIKSFVASVYRAYPTLMRNYSDADRWWIEKHDSSDPFTLADYNDKDQIFSWTATVMGIPMESLVELETWFDKNAFVVGSILPIVPCRDEPNLPTAFRIVGVPLGSPTKPPNLPKMTRRRRNDALGRLRDAADCLETTFEDRTATRLALANMDSLSQSSESSTRICYRCSEEGHIAKDCPSRNKCKLCGSKGHLASKCTASEEAALVDAEAMGAVTPRSPATKSAKPNRRFRGGRSNAAADL